MPPLPPSPASPGPTAAVLARLPLGRRVLGLLAAALVGTVGLTAWEAVSLTGLAQPPVLGYADHLRLALTGGAFFGALLCLAVGLPLWAVAERLGWRSARAAAALGAALGLALGVSLGPGEPIRDFLVGRTPPPDIPARAAWGVPTVVEGQTTGFGWLLALGALAWLAAVGALEGLAACRVALHRPRR